MDEIIEDGTVVVQATSAGFNGGNFAKITLNGKPVGIHPNENGSDRGLHIVVIDPLNGAVVLG